MLESKTAAPTADGAGADEDRPPSKVRRYVEISWVVTIVLFTLVRLLVARETLQSYGLNIWVFGVIDLVTAVPYAVGVAKVVEGLIDRRPGTTTGWAVVACVSFLAPYLYILWVGQDVEFPKVVYVVLGILIAIFGGNAIRGILRKVKVARATHGHPSLGSAREVADA